MGGRGRSGELSKQSQGGGGFRSSGSSSRNNSRGSSSDDFTRKGVGDKLGVVGQYKRGRKSTDNEFFKKRKNRK